MQNQPYPPLSPTHSLPLISLTYLSSDTFACLVYFGVSFHKLTLSCEPKGALSISIDQEERYDIPATPTMSALIKRSTPTQSSYTRHLHLTAGRFQHVLMTDG